MTSASFVAFVWHDFIHKLLSTFLNPSVLGVVFVYSCVCFGSQSDNLLMDECGSHGDPYTGQIFCQERTCCERWSYLAASSCPTFEIYFSICASIMFCPHCSQPVANTTRIFLLSGRLLQWTIFAEILLNHDWHFLRDALQSEVFPAQSCFLPFFLA